MSRRRPGIPARTGAISLLLSTALAATPSAAGAQTISRSPSRYILDCTMTAQSCLNPVTGCELIRVEQEKTTPGQCAQILAGVQAEEVGTSENVPVGEGDAVHPVYGVPVDPATVKYKGLTTGWAGKTFVLAASSLKGLYGHLGDHLKKLGWAENAARIDSCEEYAYEKYFDLSRFEDATARHIVDGDYQAIFDAAYALGNARIGYEAMTGDPLTGVDGTVIGELDLAGDSLKNELAQTPLQGYEKAGRVIVQKLDEGLSDVSELPKLGLLIVASPDLVRETAVEGLVIQDPTLRAELLAARVRYPHKDWAWHYAMAEANAAVPAAQRREIEQLEDEFVALLDQRRALARKLADLAPPLESEAHELDPTIPQLPGVEVINPGVDLVASPIIDSGWFVGDGLAFDVVGGQLAPMAYVMSAPETRRSLAVAPPVVTQNALHGEGFSWRDVGMLGEPAYLVPKVAPLASLPPPLPGLVECDALCLTGQLAWLDETIEAKLQEARALGCLDPDNALCDWSPRTFARALADGELVHVVGGEGGYLERTPSFTTLRERDLASCREYVGAGPILPRQFGPIPGYFDGCSPETDYTIDCAESPAKLEQCASCYAAQFAAVQTLAGQLVDPVTHHLRVGESTSDGVSQGSGFFGIGFDYAVSYGLSGLLAGEAKQQAVHVDAHTSARVFGHDFSLLDVAIDGGDQVAPSGSLSILGASVPISDLPFHVAQHPALNQTIFGASHDFMLGPIPIHVAGGVAGRVGVDFQLVGGAIDGGVALDADVSPYVDVNAYLTAGLGFKYASAGVRGRVVLAKVELPVHAGGRLRETSGGKLFDLSLAADLVYRFLSGQLVAYVEVSPPWPLPDWGRETELTSWDGYARVQPLFHRDVKAVPVGVLADVAQAVCAQTEGCAP